MSSIAVSTQQLFISMNKEVTTIICAHIQRARCLFTCKRSIRCLTTCQRNIGCLTTCQRNIRCLTTCQRNIGCLTTCQRNIGCLTTCQRNIGFENRVGLPALSPESVSLQASEGGSIPCLL